MASATLIASGRGQSTPAPEDKGVRGLRCPAEWPHVADAVIEASINTVVWGKKSEELGYDLRTQEGNEHMARSLFAHYGSVPWQSSAACWNRLS